MDATNHASTVVPASITENVATMTTRRCEAQLEPGMGVAEEELEFLLSVPAAVWFIDPSAL